MSVEEKIKARSDVDDTEDKEWTTEAALLAAITLNSGGALRVKQSMIDRVGGMSFVVEKDTGDILIVAESK